MAKHVLGLEVFYDAAWWPVPVLADTGGIMRGVKTRGDSDPASAKLTIDNRSGAYSPRSVASPLYGKIGQNTPARITVDGSVRLVGEVVSWAPMRPVKGPGWTEVEIAGVLQRLGRGTDVIQGALRRSVVADNPLVYWPLDDPAGATRAESGLSGGAPMVIDAEGSGLTVAFGAVDGPIVAGGDAYPQFIQNGGYTAKLVGQVTPPGAYTQWQVEAWFNCSTLLTAGIDGLPFEITLTGNSMAAKMDIILQGEGRITVYYRDAADTIVLAEPSALGLGITDGRWRQVRVVVRQDTGSLWSSRAYLDGALFWTDTGLPGLIGFPTTVRTTGHWDPFGITIPSSLSTGHIAIGTADVSHYAAGYGYLGETAADRFSRLCTEYGLTSTVVGTPADTIAMGQQRPLAILGELDEVAATDDASIFETRASAGLTMRTGASKLNQAPDFTISYLGQIRPGLRPVVGDVGIRNDVTARSPAGSTGRVERTTGPRNVKAPTLDPQGVGRYQTSIDVNPLAADALAAAAGWRVNFGTFDGTWYAEVTADLDAAPGIRAAVDALDLGDVLALSSLPVDEALDTVEGLVVGIEDDVKAGRRFVTFYCVPAQPYQVGTLAITTGETDPIVGRLETDGATTVGVTAAGAATLSVATPSGPLWTTDADDFPMDVIAGGQRVSIASIAGGASPQTFTVQAAGRRIRYPIPAGSSVIVQQPIILGQ